LIDHLIHDVHCISDFVACDALLDNMDKKCKTSINGLRVTDAIAALLPDKGTFEANIDVFRTVIRFLKHWAKRRCVCAYSHAQPHPHFTSFSHRYGNKEGLLMGVALEVMLVLVCQLYPNHSEFDILYNFFNVFAKWPWADESKGIVIITGATFHIWIQL
jgi:poly(A) polymerase Pap1